jgi:hypothetical protein
MSDFLEVSITPNPAYTIEVVQAPVVYQVETTTEAEYREVVVQALDSFTVELEPIPSYQINVTTGQQGPAGLPGPAGPSLTIRELDGSPIAGATELVLPNGTLSVVGSVVTVSGLVSSFEVFNAEGVNVFDVTRDGDGVASFNFQSSSISNGWPATQVICESETGIYLAHGATYIEMTNDDGISVSRITSAGKITGPSPTTSRASLNLPHGVAPTSPVNGDIWTTTAGTFVRINGTTVGPLGSGGSVSDALSYGVSQELTLTQLRQARSNQFVGSAPTIAYDAQGRAETLTYSDGSVKTLAYDVDGRLTQTSHLKSGRTLRKSFSYDGQNRLASVGEAII